MTDRASAPGRASGAQEQLRQIQLRNFEAAMTGDNDARSLWMEEHEAWLRRLLSTPAAALSSPSVAESPTLETHHEALRLIEKLVERDCMNWQMCGHQTCQEVRRLLLPSAPSPSAAARQRVTRRREAASRDSQKDAHHEV